MKLVSVFLLIVSSTGLMAQEQGKDFLMFSIQFGGGSYYIDEFQEQELFDFINKIEHIENYSISIHSHTDNIGGAAYNEWLSEMRGESVIYLLENRKIPRDMITKRDFGLFNPVYDNSTWLGRNKNRRVDIIFWPIIM